MTHWPRHRHPHHGPPPFVRRMGCAFAALMALAIVGTKLVSRMTDRPQAGAVAVLVVLALVIGFALSMQRVTAVFRRQDALRRQLMADVAHELRTPLAILQGRVEGLIDGVYPRDDERLTQLLDEIGHLSRLVDDLRTIANAEAGALELQKEEVELVELVREAASSFDRAIEIDAPDAVMIHADPVRIREVLLNLLTNAVRHSEEKIDIRVEARQGRVMIRVTDRGAGIPADQLPRIFDRFQKGEGSRGSGLGLAIARDLVRAHGGTIEAASVVGGGTTITIFLPH